VQKAVENETGKKGNVSKSVEIPITV